MFKRL